MGVHQAGDVGPVGQPGHGLAARPAAILAHSVGSGSKTNKSQKLPINFKVNPVLESDSTVHTM